MQNRNFGNRAKKERVIAVTELILEACKSFGIANPKIGIAGLNPHAGEGGLFGDEEIREIIPAVEEMKARGWNVELRKPARSSASSSCSWVSMSLVEMISMIFACLWVFISGTSFIQNASACC